ncbi:hypothetical protein ACFOLJ_24265 [Rugamonas sp. CCM 8940]|uniref:hypothetical protein n=1 Tax=Rugamonas sp. CCM 8940 TaxID=2765359 RepID=UPI0018F5FC01|nr:hypothetical protein [Rugamonas sp. CCM 8940]MBJ7310508.1 hypothetical protein [Rugamonas sp. CCM 8940]
MSTKSGRRNLLFMIPKNMTSLNKNTPNQKGNNTFTPLGIIALFVGLSETIAGFAAIKTEGVVQLIFTVFSVIFPIGIAVAFFSVLWKRAQVFYPPKEFGANVDVRHYAEAMRHQAVGNQELQTLVRNTIAETFGSQEAQNVIAEISTNKAAQSDTIVQQATMALAQQAVGRLQSAVVTIDIRQFRGESVAELVFPYDQNEEAFSMLSAVYFHIDDYVPPFAYGKIWALKDEATGEVLVPDGVDWSDTNALANSRVTVKEFGISPGMRLSAIHFRRIR